MKIRYSELKNIILENNFHGKNLIVEGTGGSGKTTLAQEKYINMIEWEKIKSEDIMVFVLNSHQKIDWTSKMQFDLWGQFKIDTYNNFIIKELTKYWPIVEKNCDEVKEYMIKPEIIYQDTAVYMMEMLVDYFRKNRGYF
jgi:CO dehydrogenase nickel-insertion accessory protein CooC1